MDDAWTTVSNGTSRTWTYQTSDKMQRLTWVHELCGGTLTITKPADSTVEVNPAPIIANAYTNGTPMVISAVDMTDPASVFHHWNGDVPAGCEATSRTLNYAFDGAQSLTANYDCRDWKGYAESSKYYIADHNWLFEASFDNSTGLLRITKCKGGAGVLDLRNMSVNGTKVNALKLEGGSSCFSGYSLTHFYADNLAADLCGTFYGQAGLLTVEMSGDGVTAFEVDGGSGVFDGCNALVDVRYDFPNLRKIGTFSFFGCKELTNDIATLIPRTVTNIGHRAFLSAAKVRGCLALDRCDYIGHGAFRDSGVEDVRLGDGALIRFYDYVDPVEPADKAAGTFQGASKLTNLVVNAKHFAYFGTNTVRSCTSLKTITFDSQEVIGIASSEYSPALTSVTFNGPALTTESLDNLLAGVTAKDGKKNCVLKVPQKYSSGWEALASPLNDGAEKDNAPKKCFGVYRADSRKAYMTFNGRSGLMITVR